MHSFKRKQNIKEHIGRFKSFATSNKTLVPSQKQVEETNDHSTMPTSGIGPWADRHTSQYWRMTCQYAGTYQFSEKG